MDNIKRKVKIHGTPIIDKITHVTLMKCPECGSNIVRVTPKFDGTCDYYCLSCGHVWIAMGSGVLCVASGMCCIGGLWDHEHSTVCLTRGRPRPTP